MEKINNTEYRYNCAGVSMRIENLVSAANRYFVDKKEWVTYDYCNNSAAHKLVLGIYKDDAIRFIVEYGYKICDELKKELGIIKEKIVETVNNIAASNEEVDLNDEVIKTISDLVKNTMSLDDKGIEKINKFAGTSFKTMEELTEAVNKSLNNDLIKEFDGKVDKLANIFGKRYMDALSKNCSSTLLEFIKDAFVDMVKPLVIELYTNHLKQEVVAEPAKKLDKATVASSNTDKKQVPNNKSERPIKKYEVMLTDKEWKAAPKNNNVVELRNRFYVGNSPISNAELNKFYTPQLAAKIKKTNITGITNWAMGTVSPKEFLEVYAAKDSKEFKETDVYFCHELGDKNVVVQVFDGMNPDLNKYNTRVLILPKQQK